MDITRYVLLALVIYMPFHFFEEAMGNFPNWMYTHKWMPFHLTYSHWMANNIFVFYPVLLIATGLYLLDKNTFLCCGIAVLMWGFINFGEHTFYTLKDRKVSPGLITSMIFLLNSTLGLRYAILKGTTPAVIVGAILISIVLFGLPILLNIVVGKFFKRHFV